MKSHICAEYMLTRVECGNESIQHQQLLIRVSGIPKGSAHQRLGDSLFPFLFFNSINKLYSPKEANLRGLLCATHGSAQQVTESRQAGNPS